MLFKDLKQNYPVYILDKQDIKMKQGKVTSVSFPHYDNNYRPSSAQSNMQMIVDVTIEADGKTAIYSMPENASITFAGDLVLSTEQAGLTREVEAMKNQAEMILASVERQKEIVDKATALLTELNPAFKEKRENEERFGKIESSIANLSDMMQKFINEFKS